MALILIPSRNVVELNRGLAVSIVTDWTAAPELLPIYGLDMIPGGFAQSRGPGGSASRMKLLFIDLKIGDYSKSRGTEYLFDADNQAASVCFQAPFSSGEELHV